MRPAITIIERSGSNSAPTLSFARLYRKLTGFLAAVFPPDENPQSPYPPTSAEEFVCQRFVAAPALHRSLAQELWTLLSELNRNQRKVNEKTLHDHQFAHLIWIAATLTSGPNSPTSFFIQGAPGTGKTLTLGVLMQACIRLQMRGMLKEKIAYCTAKPYHLSDKIRGRDMGHRRILRTPPYAPTAKDINRRRLGLCRMDSKFMKNYFPKAAWDRLFAQRPSTPDEARERVEDYFREAGLESDASTEAMLENGAMLEKVVKVLASNATTVRGPFGSTELLTFPPLPNAVQQIASHTGDAAFAIPPGYPIFARESIGISTATRGDARVILEPATAFTSSQQIARYQEEFHRHVQVILCDEAQRRHPLTFQEPVLSAGAKHAPLVFAAGSKWYDKAWDCRSPTHSFPESIRRGILPDLGVRLFPSALEPHYPSETEESLQQLLESYFQPLPSFENLGLPPPCDVNTLVVVHNRLVDTVVERLRKAHGERKPAAQVRPFHGDEEDREALQIWFDSAGAGPNILVSSATIVKESLDLRSLRHLVVGVRVTADVLYHLIGRLAHGRGQCNAADRRLLTLQQFANSNLAATPFVALDHGQSFPVDGFTWINGHALMSARAFQRDARRFKGRGDRDNVTVPGHGRTKRGQPPSIALACGRSLLPGHNGQLIDPTLLAKTSAMSNRFALGPVARETYDPNQGPPSREVARQWAAECGGLPIFETYPSIMLSIVDAHHQGCNPRQALEQKIARLRERGHALSR